MASSSSRPELQCHGISKEQARKLSEACRQNDIRLIPLFNCLGRRYHQGRARCDGRASEGQMMMIQSLLS